MNAQMPALLRRLNNLGEKVFLFCGRCTNLRQADKVRKEGRHWRANIAASVGIPSMSILSTLKLVHIGGAHRDLYLAECQLYKRDNVVVFLGLRWTTANTTGRSTDVKLRDLP